MYRKLISLRPRFLLSVLSVFLLSRFIHVSVSADTCISQAEWDSLKNQNNHCYVTYSSNNKTEVYDPPLLLLGNTRTHKGNDICGTDVTSIIPVSHTSNTAKYLSDTLVGTLKASCEVQPVATSTPYPTATPYPTSKPTTTPMITSSSQTSTPTPISSTPILSTPTPEPQLSPTPGLLSKKTTSSSVPSIPSPTPTPKSFLSSTDLLKISSITSTVSLIILLITTISWPISTAIQHKKQIKK